MSVFGWDYPPGSMRGSGIYSDSWDEERYCPDCDATREGITDENDFGSRAWTCSTCDFSTDLDDEDDDGVDSWNEERG
jgi:rubredoxin